MKRIIASTGLSFIVFGILYEVGFFDYFFLDDGYSALKGIALLCVVFLIISLSIHLLLDKWVRYEQILEFVVKDKRFVEVQLSSTVLNDGSTMSVMSGPNEPFYAHEYFITYGRKDALEEDFEKEVPENVYNAFQEGDLVHVHKKRTIVATHYTVVREKVIPQKF